MIASPSREARLREGSGDASEIDRESVEWGRGRGRTESAIADKSHRAADNAPLSPSSGAATLKAFQPRHHSYIFLSPAASLSLSLSLSLSPFLLPRAPRFRRMFRDLFTPPTFYTTPIAPFHFLSGTPLFSNQPTLFPTLVPLSRNNGNDLNFSIMGKRETEFRNKEPNESVCRWDINNFTTTRSVEINLRRMRN